MTTTAPWATDALDSLLSANARRMAGSHWVSPSSDNPIEFTGGIPDPETLPADALAEAAQLVLRREPEDALQYGGAQGYLRLRELVAERVVPYDSLGPDNLALTSGGYPALHMICDAFLDPGDVVLADAPAWGGFLRVARAVGAEVVGVPLDDEGPSIEAAEEAIARATAEGKRVKLIYCIPTFQNPMGITFSADRRQALIDLAARHKVLIVEDDPYGDLRFVGERVPSIYALAGGEGVLKAGTFSKIIATGLRVGWIQASKEFIDATLRMRFDNGTSPFVCRTIAAYIEGGTLEPHIEKMRGVYRSKCDVMLSALSESCSNLATWTQPDGGFFIWVTTNDGISLQDVMRFCGEERVAVVPGTSFFTGGGGGQNIRLAFSNVGESDIAEGIRRLARALDRARAAAQA
ncbi:MAG: PLP-dependent aminotransferase family protein [Dehalococcoidia bacterium]